MLKCGSSWCGVLCDAKAGHFSHTSKPASTATSLALPAFDNVRPFLYPAAQKVTVHQIRFMAKVLLAINPDYRMSWPAGTLLEDVAVDIIGGIEKKLNTYEKKQDMSSDKICVYVNKENGLTITVNVVDDIMPIFYEDLRKVKNEAPEMLPLFHEALRLLVAKNACVSAEDVRWVGKDLYEEYILPDAESYDEETFEEEKKFYDRLLNSGPKEVFFDITKKTFRRRYDAFKKAVVGLKKVTGGYQKVCQEWLLKVVSCLEMNFDMIRQAMNDDDCLSFEYAFPILWERDDAITEMFDRQINETFQSGIDVIPVVSFELPWNQTRLLPEIRKFKDVIRTLALMRDLFSFFE